ncbi:MAG TPA: hypothetical protein VFY45_20480 [Baekduia sp.]|nr:hypothetical protein [Baekduia sp.]
MADFVSVVRRGLVFVSVRGHGLLMMSVALSLWVGGSVVASPAVAVNGPPLEVTDFSARSLDAADHDYTVAGGNPYQAVTSFQFSRAGYPGITTRVDDARMIFTELPPGVLGNAAAAARCRPEQLATFPLPPACPADSKIGEIQVDSDHVEIPVALYNMVPDKGYPAQFAFAYSFTVVQLYPVLRPRTRGYGVTVASPGATAATITGVKATVFGVPSDRTGGGGVRLPFLSNPSDCLDGSPTTRIFVDSWVHPARLLASGVSDFGFPDLSDPLWKSNSEVAPPVTGCEVPALASQFRPRLDMRPTPSLGTTQADAPSGYTVKLDFPQSNDPTDTASTFDPSVPMAPPLKDTTVTLPAGVAISASGADGLDGCSDEEGPGDQVHYDTTNPVSCPDASKIGSAVATTPLLVRHEPGTDAVIGAEPLAGDVFIIKPHPGDLDPSGAGDGKFRVLLQVDSRKYGVNAKLPGVVTADRNTGRLVARFENNPQVPVKHVELTFMAGDRAALVNPVLCGRATTAGLFVPWSRGGTRSDGVVVAGTPDATADSSFDVSWDGRGGGCPSALPFGPVMSAGVADTQAGSSSPFTFDLSREDRTDVINGLDVSLPGGLLAAIKNVQLCSDTDAYAGTCPVGSRVGSASVAAGAGGSPFYLSGQPVWLTGPYKGAPYGLAIAVHAVAGPFDLGTVVVRQALQVDPDDAHATVVSDPIPTIRDGVPFRVRRIHVSVNRPGFIQLPTSCQPKTITATASSPSGQTANLTAPFQADGCSKLRFAPKLSIKLTNPKETKVGGHPGFETLVTQSPGESGFKNLTVTLPLSLALDPNNAESDSLCEYTDGLRNLCPEKSVIGTMTAVSPLLKAPLSGKIYFVKGVRTDPKSGRQIRTLPTLLIQLRGEVNINLRATNSVPDNKHLTTTFASVPDAPISSALVKINGGKKGILVVTDGHDDLCYTPQTPFLAAAGQSGKRYDAPATMTVQCPLAVVSRTFTKTTAKVRVSGIGPGKLTVSGPGLQTSRRTISSATSAIVTLKLTPKGRQMRKTGRDIRVKAVFVAKGAKTPKTAYSTKPKH